MKMRVLFLLVLASALAWAQSANAANRAASSSSSQMQTVQRAAARGDAGAQSLLGVIHMQQAFAAGAIHPADLSDAIHWFQAASANPAINAQLKSTDQTLLGFLLAASHQDAASRKALAAPVERKDALAEFVMAMTFSPNTPDSLPRAGLKWLGDSGQHGFAPASIALGLMYLEGSGVPREPIMALHWLEVGSQKRLQASSLGLSDRQQQLKASMGKPDDEFAQALRELLEGEINESSPWLQRAASQNYLLAELTIAQLALKNKKGEYANAAVSRRWFIGAMIGTLSDPDLRTRWLKPLTTITISQ